MDVSTKRLSVFKYKLNEIEFLTDVSFTGPKNVLEALNERKISINQSCGGNGSCTTCRVLIRSSSAELETRTEIEFERAQERNFQPHERLACQLSVSDSVEIIIP